MLYHDLGCEAISASIFDEENVYLGNFDYFAGHIVGFVSSFVNLHRKGLHFLKSDLPCLQVPSF